MHDLPLLALTFVGLLAFYTWAYLRGRWARDLMTRPRADLAAAGVDALVESTLFATPVIGPLRYRLLVRPRLDAAARSGAEAQDMQAPPNQDEAP